MNRFETPPKSRVATPFGFSIAPILRESQRQHATLGAQRQAIRVPLPWETHCGGREKVAFVVPDVLDEAECDAIIQTCEAKGFEQALLNVGGGRQVLASDVRKSGRCIIDDDEAADLLFERLRHFLPETYENAGNRYDADPGASWQCVGLNERLRVLKYEPGDYFAPHRDGAFQRPTDAHAPVGQPGDTSFFTLMLYLNTPGKGGGTNFLSVCGKCRPYNPIAGQVLVFDHSIRHEGATLEKGVKYAIRTDVMYRRYVDTMGTLAGKTPSPSR